MFVTLITRSAATDRFAAILDALCRSVAASSGMTGPLNVLIWSRLRRVAARFAAAAARVGSGVRPAGMRHAGMRHAARIAAEPGDTACGDTACGGTVGAASRPAASPARQRLPGGFGWLVRLAPETTCHGSQLQHLLSDPEMTALLAAAPQIRRLLRPLCRMLAVEPGPDLMPSGARERSAARRQSRADARGPVRVRRCRVPRVPGLAWLRWRPVGAAE